jgi:hypothetical protein
MELLSQAEKLKEVELIFSVECQASSWRNRVTETTHFRKSILVAFFGALAKADKVESLTIENLQDDMSNEVFESEDFKAVRGCLKKLHLLIATEHDEAGPEHDLDMAVTVGGFTRALPSYWLKPMTQLKALFGYCHLRPEWEIIFQGHRTPPVFHKYARNFELSLNPDFGRSFICGNIIIDLPMVENPHDSYDFHWLHLSRFRSLRTVKIWVNARSKEHRFDPKEIVLGIKELGVKAFADNLSAFENIDSVTISTPLGPSFEPEDGLVRNFAVPNVTLYKRGSGDRFHPPLYLVDSESHYDNNIHTCPTR